MSDFSVVEILNAIKYPQGQIRRVPAYVRNRQRHDNVYDPAIVSLGPYHHGRKQLFHAEAFKQACLAMFVADPRGNKDESFYHKKILDRIVEIRGWYEKVDYDDNDLAWMMLRDACFFIFFMYADSRTSESKDKLTSALHSYFGHGAKNIIFFDLIMLENQVPLWIIRFLFSLQSEEEGESNFVALLDGLMNYSQIIGTWTDSIHFLDAHCKKLKMEMGISPHVETRGKGGQTYLTGSATNLRAKGIHIKLNEKGPSGISFTSYSLSGMLRLPNIFVSVGFFTYYCNLIAYEMSPTTDKEPYTLSLISFMKSLIQSSDDVRLLREKGIVWNDVGSDEQVAEMFKDVATYGPEILDDFRELRNEINRHCSRLANTWVADLMETYLANPWKIMALFAAVAVLGLTATQTQFTIHPS